MPGPTARTQEPQVAVPSHDPSPQPVERGTPQTAQTQWNIDYDTLFPGPSDRDQALHARTPDSALYLDLKVAPNGEPGKDAPAPVPFVGIDLARSGAAHLGTLGHPKGQGGKVSGSIGAGKRPTFSFAMKSKALSGAAAKTAHNEIALLWSRRLDDFVTEAQAKELLQSIVTDRYPDDEVELRVSRVDHSGSAVNATSLNYGSVNSDRTFNLKLVTPTAAKDHNVVKTSSENGEATTGTEATQQTSINTDVGTTSATEATLTSQVKRTIESGLNTLSQNIIATELASDLTTSHIDGNSTKVGGGFSLKSVIDGALEFNPGQLLQGIPGIGSLLSKIGSAKLNVHLEPNFSSLFEFDWNHSTDTIAKLGTQTKSDLTYNVASLVKNQTENLMTTTLKTSIAAATKVSTANTAGAKRSDGGKTSHASGRSETSGTVDIVKAALQPSIIEE